MKSVFCLGVWDMFHAGHLNLINEAARQGEHLTVGVVCDRAVQVQKGKDRPVIWEEHRLAIVSNLKFVNSAIIVPDFIIPDSYLQCMDVIVIGGDQTHIKNLKDIPKFKLKTIARFEGASTSDIIKKIRGEN